MSIVFFISSWYLNFIETNVLHVQSIYSSVSNPFENEVSIHFSVVSICFCYSSMPLAHSTYSVIYRPKQQWNFPFWLYDTPYRIVCECECKRVACVCTLLRMYVSIRCEVYKIKFCNRKI